MDMSNRIHDIKTYKKGRFSDWRYLIVIDACRYDTFGDIVEERELQGELLKCHTGSHKTSWWYRRYWSREDCDVHLISSNPVPFSSAGGWNAYQRFKTSTWADPESKRLSPEVREIVEGSLAAGVNLFDPLIPLTVFEEVKRHGERYLIHLMPPHLPFLGEKGVALLNRLGVEIGRTADIYAAVQEYARGDNWDEVRECYKENIEFALGRIGEFSHLLDDGGVVITADHGELTGEKRDGLGIYRHARHNKIPELFDVMQTVPWFELAEGEIHRL